MVVVTGMGIVTSLGNTVHEHKDALLSQKQVLGPPGILQTVHRNDTVAGEIKITNEQLMQQLNIRAKGVSRTTLLGIYAMNEALAGLAIHKNTDKEIAFINATTVGGMSDVENLYFEMIHPQPGGAYLDYIDSLDCADCTHGIASHFGLRGFMTTISTACSSSANAIQMGARMIASGETDIAICGGTDSLTRFTLNGFNALKNVDKQPCRPFDHNRRGLNLGEGAAYLVLESLESARARKAEIIAGLAGYGNTNEAYHPTAPAPDGAGARRTMEEAIFMAGIKPADISYINAHGTATLGNDLSEGNAIQSLFGIKNHPPFSSTKAFTGHTLAAAGAVEAILCCLAIKYSFIPPNLRYETRMQELHIEPQSQLLLNRPVQYALSNSFGFGGNNASLLFQKM